MPIGEHSRSLGPPARPLRSTRAGRPLLGIDRTKDPRVRAVVSLPESKLGSPRRPPPRKRASAGAPGLNHDSSESVSSMGRSRFPRPPNVGGGLGLHVLTSGPPGQSARHVGESGREGTVNRRRVGSDSLGSLGWVATGCRASRQVTRSSGDSNQEISRGSTMRMRTNPFACRDLSTTELSF
jgi:hypothetical protein